MKKKLNIKIIIIGTINKKIKSKNIHITGRYNSNQLVELVEKNMIDVLFIPSVCPETFSYTTEESINMGLPVAVFNIGAPAERVKRYNKGIVIKKIEPEFALKELLEYFWNHTT